MDVYYLINTERLLIRRLEKKDAKEFFDYRAMPEIYRYQSWKPTHINEAEEFIDLNIGVVPNTPDAWLQLAICLKDGRLIGDMGIHFLDDDQIEIGYTLSPDAQGNGYASEAVSAVVSYIFSELKKHRVTASVDPDNVHSIKLLERIGFRKEAHFIKSYRMDDRWCDDCIYAMLEEDWKQQWKHY